MTRLAITHETRYEYDREVPLGQWRLMPRPTDSHALRVVSAKLEVSPQAATRWAYDAFGNSVCFLDFTESAAVLAVTSRLVVDRYPNPIAASADDLHTPVPVLYDTADLLALAPLIRPVTEDPDAVLRRWIRTEVLGGAATALELLQKLNQLIHGQFQYTVRHEEGVQGPVHTLALKSGSCRDYAWLMIETVRRLGFAARFASGYVAPAPDATSASSTTHAWCEVFLPSLGWIEFDPTNALTESADLIRVASTRIPEEAAPMRGTLGKAAASSLYVAVNVEHVPAEPPVG
ncbi:MAG TPA: transglutaminase family protein [Steroidobacteraceae bacterium]|nr:transglutaminase family protein [Steroidobacteraceae bacterium]